MSIDLVEFSCEFINLARDFASEYPGIKKQLFTSRQSIAISNLGTTRIIRKNSALAVQDLIELAVVTTPPEAQKFAEFVALRVVYGDESQYFTNKSFSQPAQQTEQQTDAPQPIVADVQLTGQKILLDEILNLLNLNQSVNVDKDITYHRFADTVEQELFSEKRIDNPSSQFQPPNEEAPVPQLQLSDEERLLLARKRISYELIYGREGIIKHQLVNWDAVFEAAKRIMLQTIPSISNEELGQSQLLGYADEVSKLTREQYIHIIADLLVASGLRNEEEIQQEIEEGLDYFTQYQLSRSYNIMQEYRGLLYRAKVRESYYAPLLEVIIQRIKERIRHDAKTLDDILAHPEIFKDQKWSRDQLMDLYENTTQYTGVLEMMDKVLKFDETFQTNVSDIYEEDIPSLVESVQFQDFMEHPIPSPQWVDALDQYLNSMQLDQYSWNDLDQLQEQFQEAKSKLNSQVAQKRLNNNIGTAINEMMSTSGDFDQLQHTVDLARKESIRLSNKDIKQKGEELNLSKEEIAQLLGDFVNYLETLMESGEALFERVDNILQNQQLTSQQFDRLLKKGIQTSSEGMIGSLANQDLQKVANELDKVPNGEELLQAGLGAGGGENLLKQWFKAGKQLPASARKIVKEAAKRVMIDLAKAKALALIGSSEAGPLPNGTTRPYTLGDEADTIDLDESLDHILALGKQVRDIEAEDFIVRKTVSGRRAVIFLIDISGSMNGAPLASASLAAAMLLFAFSRDELGLALFESNTHVLCEINQPIDTDQIVDEVLDLTARGGTQMQKAVKWAEEQLVQSKSQDKMLVMLTDAMIGDFARTEPHLSAIAELGTTSVLIMPHTARGVGSIHGILERSNAQLVTVDNWENFPEVVSEVLSRS